MNKAEFFIKAINAGRLSEKRWIIRALSVVLEKVNSPTFADMRPYDILYRMDESTKKIESIFIDESGNMIELSDVDRFSGEPVYKYAERIQLKTGDLPNVDRDVDTRYGNVIVNWLLLIYPFGDKIPFMTGYMTIKNIESIIEKRLVSDGVEVSKDDITIDEYYKYRKATGIIDGLTQLCVPSLTEKAMTGHPDRFALRDKLLKQYADRLHDPAIVAKIDAELVKLDREWLKDDPSMGFYYQDKSFTNVRKKLHYMHGITTAFGDGTTGVTIPTSLSEGWDIDKLPQYANTLREGSYDRGSSTALGGEAVKFILRVMQNSIISEDDCGSTIGFPYRVTDENKQGIYGNYIIEGTTLKKLDENNIGKHVGKVVGLRSPMYCRTKGANFCKTCIGERYAESPTGLATAAANIGSTLMLIFMAKTHVSEVKVAKYDFKQSMT